MTGGHVDPAFEAVAETFRRQLAGHPGGASLAIYHGDNLLVDLWGGDRDNAGQPWLADTIAMCNSATKGVVATAVHVLASRGLVEYDAPVADYWPEFAANGKQNLTVRHVLSHSAGLHKIKPLIERPQQILDWNHMAEALAAAAPAYRPGSDAGYHALTFGWLAGEIIRRVTGQPVDAFVRDELATPMGLGGLYMGCPLEARDRVAPLLLRRKPMPSSTLPAGVMPIVHSPEIMDVPVPALNGFVTARSLAAMYSMLANAGRWHGSTVIAPQTIHTATKVQGRRRDRVVILPMHWRLGYHRIFNMRHTVEDAFGHYGFGGSGGWADPRRQLGIAMICNRDTKGFDTRLLRIAQAIERSNWTPTSGPG